MVLEINKQLDGSYVLVDVSVDKQGNLIKKNKNEILFVDWKVMTQKQIYNVIGGLLELVSDLYTHIEVEEVDE